MKIMKKIFKSRILLVIVTVILTGSISVYAAGRYYANQVDYEPSNPNFNVDNMADALDQLYTTQNTTISNLNNQITTLTGQVSAKDATISDLQTQLNGISTTDCIRGTATLTSACGTNSGCVIENKFAPNFFALQFSKYNFTLIYDKARSTTHYFETYDGALAWNKWSDYYRISGNSLIGHHFDPDFQSGTITYIACR
ncbi:MAG: hypothetical protein E7158_05100 [Firmicutes bacterium]|nr:hypothetical protein [Bacillota bacterium]